MAITFLRRGRVLAAAVLLLCSASFVSADAKVTVIKGPGVPGVGFDDTTAAAPVGGNPGTTVGEQAFNVFQRAADIWGANLDSPVEIFVHARFVPLACTASAGVLGSARTNFIVNNFGQLGAFPGPVRPDIWHHSALADKRAGAELIPEVDPAFPASPRTPDILTNFNSDLGKPGCLQDGGWYYGFDANESGGKFDLLAVILHEFGHGLGFSQFGSVTSGALPAGFPDVYNVRLLDTSSFKHWDEMTNAERAASAVNSRRLMWDGPAVFAAAPSVLQAGTPILSVTSPAAIAGLYPVGTAGFGAALNATGITGDVVLAIDAANAQGPSVTDGCTPLTNAAAVAGKIALLDRGTCGFTVKVKNAQDAGAIAVLVADNVAGGPPAGLGGADPAIVIPSVRIMLSDGGAIKSNLATGVRVTLGLDLSLRAGADEAGRLHMNAPNPVQQGSSVSHYDPIATPNLLMEPNINSDLTHSLVPPDDLTLAVMRDVGWFADGDSDGLDDQTDACLGSDLASTISVAGSNTGVENVLFTNGCTIQDLIDNAAANAATHGDFVSSVTELVNTLRDAGIIDNADRKAIHGAASQSNTGR